MGFLHTCFNNNMGGLGRNLFCEFGKGRMCNPGLFHVLIFKYKGYLQIGVRLTSKYLLQLVVSEVL